MWPSSCSIKPDGVAQSLDGHSANCLLHLLRKPKFTLSCSLSNAIYSAALCCSSREHAYSGCQGCHVDLRQHIRQHSLSSTPNHYQVDSKGCLSHGETVRGIQTDKHRLLKLTAWDHMATVVCTRVACACACCHSHTAAWLAMPQTTKVENPISPLNTGLCKIHQQISLCYEAKTQAASKASEKHHCTKPCPLIWGDTEARSYIGNSDAGS